MLYCSQEGEKMYTDCKLCPRMCGVDRTKGEKGYCGGPAEALVAKTMIHKWEEPALAGSGGSGAIFFGGCTLGCKYCQNMAISGKPVGQPVNGAALRQMMEQLIAEGAENIDLVTPTHYLPTILEALETPLAVPVVYNCGGYERVESLKLLEGKVDIYLIRGVIIRHLILPGQVENSLKVLDFLGEHFANDVLVSLMRQYTPMGGLPAPFDRTVTDEEYDAGLSWMYLNDLEGFAQEDSAAEKTYIPDF